MKGLSSLSMTVSFHINLIDSSTCLCGNDVGDLGHFLLYCSKSNELHNSFLSWWNRLADIEISLENGCLEECSLSGF